MQPDLTTIEVDFLIVGAGPAGASLACFLGKYGTEPELRRDKRRRSPLKSTFRRLQGSYDQLCSILSAHAASTHH